jgi:hypothetical protein
MPITRRRRANPPEQQPEINYQLAEQAEQQPVEAPQTPAVEQPPAEPLSASESPQNLKEKKEPKEAKDAAEMKATKEMKGAREPKEPQEFPLSPSVPPSQTSPTTPTQSDTTTPVAYQSFVPTTPSSDARSNGERVESTEAPTQPQQSHRPERMARLERQEYANNAQPMEGGRRTARGEYFRRPPQPPTLPQTPMPVTQQPQLQPPSHEISLPLGNLLHLAYNPGYTGSDEARSALLHQLANESKAGGRARCWSCGSLAIVYDRWNTRSKTFGEVGIAYCEICGVWSVL